MVNVKSMKISVFSRLISIAALVFLVHFLGTGGLSGAGVVSSTSTGQQASSHDSTYPPAHTVASSTSYNIVNDEQWYVKVTTPKKNDKEIEANYGGKITHLGQYWYWVGTGHMVSSV